MRDTTLRDAHALLLALGLGLALLAPQVSRAETPGAAARLDTPTMSVRDARAVLRQGGTPRQEVMKARVERSRALQRQALASLLPQAGINATGTRNGQEIAIGERVFTPLYNWNVAGNASMVVFNGTLYPEYERAGRVVTRAEEEARWVEQSLTFEVTQAALVVQAAQRDVAIVEETIALREANMAQAEALSQAGLGVPLDVARAQTQLLEAQQALIDAELARVNAAASLQVLLGQEPDGVLHVSGELEALPDASRADISLEERADLRAQALQIEELDLGKRAVFYSYFPTLSLSADARFGPPTVANPDGFIWGVSLNAGWLIYAGGLRQARELQLEAEARELEATRRDLLLGALDELGQVERQIGASLKRIDVAVQRVEVARRAITFAKQRYNAGLATTLEVREATDDLFNAEQTLNRARLDVALQQTALDYFTAVAR